MEKKVWSPTVMLIDADYLDEITSEIVAGLARDLHREFSPADLCTLLENFALEGGLRGENHPIHAIFLHEKFTKQLFNFLPSSFEREISGKAFRGAFGEFNLLAFEVEEIVTMGMLFGQCFELLRNQPEVERLILVGNFQDYGAPLLKAISNTPGKQISALSMKPFEGKGLDWRNIAYSLAAALGIGSEDL